MSALQIVLPKKKAVKGMLCGIPSFGMVSVEFMQNITQQCPPINFGMGYMTPAFCRWDWAKNEPYEDLSDNGKYIPVDEGRNIIAYHALKGGCEWVFFRDDDTMAPAESVNKLFSLARFAADNGIKVPVVGGVYYSKQQPPHALILCDEILAGYENYQPGEIIECMAIGMGITLIHTSLFAEIKPPWFKTVQGVNNNDIQDLAPGGARMTEDVYFCKKAAAAGHKILCDTSLQGWHQDFENRTMYGRHGQLGLPCWIHHNVMYYYPPFGHPLFDKMQKERAEKKRAEVQDPVKLNMGSGPEAKEGYVNIDLTCTNPGITTMNACDIPALKAKFGNVTKILAEDFIEHMPIAQAVATVKGWASLLAPGGEIEIATPDVEWVMENLKRYLDDDVDSRALGDAEARIFGAQRWAGDEHRMLLGEKQLRQLLEVAGFTNVGVTKKDCENPHEIVRKVIQVSLIAKGTKPVVMAPNVEGNGHRSGDLILDDHGGAFKEEAALAVA